VRAGAGGDLLLGRRSHLRCRVERCFAGRLVGGPVDVRGRVAEAALDECSKENLTLVNPGTLTIGTDTPAYPPYFVTDDEAKQDEGDPASGQGFESAVAYAVADQLGFATNEVNWTVVPFNSSYAPGDKAFDFDINQISITPKRAKVVDFSDGYYTVNQAVVALKDSPIANATTVAELQGAKLGAQIGTTSLDFINDVVKPAEQPFVYNDTNDAKTLERTDRRTSSTCPRRTTSPRSNCPRARSSASSRRRRAASSSACSSRRATRWSPASTRRLPS
jgi:polar amino acid transport system substrate-binding protein